MKRRPRKVRAGYRYSLRKLVQLSPRYFVAGKSDLSCCIASRGIPKFFAARVGFATYQDCNRILCVSEPCSRSRELFAQKYPPIQESFTNY